MRTPTLIITRPRIQAERLAESLHKQGVHAFIFPLLEIRSIDQTSLKLALQNLSEFALVIFVSPSAIDIALKAYAQLTVMPWSTPIAVLGAGSIRALNQYGINHSNTRIISPLNLDQEKKADVLHFDSEHLLRALAQSELDMQALSKKRVLIIQGMGGRELLAQSLQQAGVDLTVVEIYQRYLPTPNVSLWQALKKVLHHSHAWLFTSSEAVKNLYTLHQTQPWLSLTSALATHPRIAEAAKQIGFSNIALINNLQESDSIPILLKKMTF